MVSAVQGLRMSLLALALGCLSTAAAAGATKCPFTYTPQVRDRIVAPVMKAYLSKDIGKYDLTRPYIVDFGDSAGLDFDSRSGKRSERVVVMFDYCRRTAHIAMVL